VAVNDHEESVLFGGVGARRSQQRGVFEPVLDNPVPVERRRFRMKFELILAVDSGDGQITNVQLAQMTRPDVQRN